MALPALRAEDWTTLDGRSYHGVKVVKVEADAVTILDDEGGALIPLAKLPPELHTRFHYDEAKARVAASTRARLDAASTQALLVEAKQRPQAEAEKKTKPVASTPTVKTGAITGDPNHHDQDSLLQGGLSSDERDPSYPAGNADGKNTSGQRHPLQVP